jgi:hypothetical protein
VPDRSVKLPSDVAGSESLNRSSWKLALSTPPNEMSLIAPTSDVLMKDSENLIVSSKLTIPVPKFATRPVVLSPGAIVPRSNVEAAAGRPVRPPTSPQTATLRVASSARSFCLSRGQRRLKRRPPTSTIACAIGSAERGQESGCGKSFSMTSEKSRVARYANQSAVSLPKHAGRSVGRTAPVPNWEPCAAICISPPAE